MELKKYKLGDIAEVTTGFPFDGNLYSNNGIRVVRGENIGNGEMHWDKRIDKRWEGSLSNLSKYYLFKGDIVMQMDGNVGKNISIILSEEPMLIAQRVACIRAKHLDNQKFVYHILRSKYFNTYIKNNATGTSVKHISLQQIKDFSIPLPNRNWKQIGNLLSSLDQKIALNRKINDNLEAMAKQLYDYWFVQFDFPNEEGKPYKSSGGKMVWSEKLKREIPEGWDIKSLNDIVKVKDGTHDSPKQQNEGYFLITSKNLLPTGIDFKTAYYISEEDYKAINKRSKVDTNDILFSMIGTIGNKYLVSEETINFAIKNMALIKSSDNAKFMYFLWFYLSSPDYIRYEYNAISGSIQKFLSLDAMRNIPILFNEKILTLFNKKVSEICKLISNTNNENILLSKQRDELLPLLMNGQVSVI